jgi:hypothetical protein
VERAFFTKRGRLRQFKDNCNPIPAQGERKRRRDQLFSSARTRVAHPLSFFFQRVERVCTFDLCGDTKDGKAPKTYASRSARWSFSSSPASNSSWTGLRPVT